MAYSKVLLKHFPKGTEKPIKTCQDDWDSNLEPLSTQIYRTSWQSGKSKEQCNDSQTETTKWGFEGLQNNTARNRRVRTPT
jgi:hypothetical protein